MSDDLLSHLTFDPVNKGTIGLLKIIHRELLPVHYSDAIYEVIKNGKEATGELAFLYGDTAVGEVCYRIESTDQEKKLYIMTIGVLKTYQRKGLGKRLLERAIEKAKATDPTIKEAYLHVHAENSTAMEFYQKAGFTKGELMENFYTELENGNAYIFHKVL